MHHKFTHFLIMNKPNTKIHISFTIPVILAMLFPSFVQFNWFIKIILDFIFQKSSQSVWNWKTVDYSTLAPMIKPTDMISCLTQ